MSEVQKHTGETSAEYWRDKYYAVIRALEQVTVVADGGQYRADVIESIKGLAKERDEYCRMAYRAYAQLGWAGVWPPGIAEQVLDVQKPERSEKAEV